MSLVKISGSGPQSVILQIDNSVNSGRQFPHLVISEEIFTLSSKYMASWRIQMNDGNQIRWVKLIIYSHSGIARMASEL